MSADSIRDVCCPDLWDKINELESELERMREIDATKIDKNKLFDELKEQDDEHQQSVSD